MLGQALRRAGHRRPLAQRGQETAEEIGQQGRIPGHGRPDRGCRERACARELGQRRGIGEALQRRKVFAGEAGIEPAGGAVVAQHRPMQVPGARRGREAGDAGRQQPAETAAPCPSFDIKIA